MKVRELLRLLRDPSPDLDVAVHIEPDGRVGSYPIRRVTIRGGAVQKDQNGDRVFMGETIDPEAIECCWVELET